MDPGQRIELITWLRSQLSRMSFADAALTLGEFGFWEPNLSVWTGGFAEDRGLDPILRNGSDDELIALASHLGAEGRQREQAAAARPGSEPEELLIFASHHHSIAP